MDHPRPGGPSAASSRERTTKKKTGGRRNIHPSITSSDKKRRRDSNAHTKTEQLQKNERERIFAADKKGVLFLARSTIRSPQILANSPQTTPHFHAMICTQNLSLAKTNAPYRRPKNEPCTAVDYKFGNSSKPRFTPEIHPSRRRQNVLSAAEDTSCPTSVTRSIGVI